VPLVATCAFCDEPIHVRLRAEAGRGGAREARREGHRHNAIKQRGKVGQILLWRSSGQREGGWARTGSVDRISV